MEYNIHEQNDKINHAHHHMAGEEEDDRRHHLWRQQHPQHGPHRRTVAATVLALGLLVVGAAVMVFGAPYRRRTIIHRPLWRTTTTTTAQTTTESRQGNFLDASDMVYVDDLGGYLYIYNDDDDDDTTTDDDNNSLSLPRVFLFTGLCENNTGTVQGRSSAVCGTYDTDCPNEGRHSFCVCGAVWTVAVYENVEQLTISTPNCNSSYPWNTQQEVLYADLASTDDAYYPSSPMAVDLSNIDTAADSDTLAQAVADRIVNSDNYQSFLVHRCPCILVWFETASWTWTAWPALSSIGRLLFKFTPFRPIMSY